MTKRLWLAIFIAAVTSLGAVVAFAGDPAQELPTLIQVSTGEPVAAESQQLAIIGSCYEMQVAVRFFPDHLNGEHYATIKVGESPEARYDAFAPFVKDFFVGSKTTFQFRLFCSRDARRTIMLTAIGVSLALADAKYVQAKVIFDASGKILSYGPPREEDPYFIRRGLR